MADHFFGITDTGKVRDNNEDAFIAQATRNNQLVIACVIDGVGGYEGGEIAAAIARDVILHSFQHHSGDILSLMRNAFAAANEKIYREKLESGKNSDMACVLTLAVVDIRNNKFYYAHVGDTRLYLLRDHSLVKLTRDQSFVGFLEDSGRLTEEEAMSHPKRNEINKALGFDQQANFSGDYMETGESPFLPGDTVLLCSDGLTDMLNAGTIRAILDQKTSLEIKGKKLIEAANQAGGKDNITVVLVQNTKRPAKQEAKKPVLVKKQLADKPPEVTESPVRPVPGPVAQKAKTNKSLVPVLSVLCLLFLAGFLWLWWKQSAGASPADESTKKEKNAQEIRLQSYINSSVNDTIELSEATLGNTIYLTDTIWVRRDSLYLKGSGNTRLVRHSSFINGPALMITPQCRSIVLDSLTLQDFGIAIITSNPEALELRNTNFKNCPVAVAYKFIPDSVYVNGAFIKNHRRK